MIKNKGVSLTISSLILIIVGISVATGVWLYTQRYTKIHQQTNAQLNLVDSRIINNNSVYAMSLLIQSKPQESSLLKKIEINIIYKNGTISHLILIPQGNKWVLNLSKTKNIIKTTKTTKTTNTSTTKTKKQGGDWFIIWIFFGFWSWNNVYWWWWFFWGWIGSGYHHHHHPKSTKTNTTKTKIITNTTNPINVYVYPSPPIYINSFNHTEISILIVSKKPIVEANTQLYLQTHSGEKYVVDSNSINLG